MLPTDNILEIGYVTGSLLRAFAQTAVAGQVMGIEHSPSMNATSLEKCRQHMENNRLHIHCGTLHDLSYPDGYFDLVCGINVHFFWTRTVPEFRHIGRLLKKGGRMVFVFQPRWIKNDAELKALVAATRTQFKQAGFSNLTIAIKNMKPVSAVYIAGTQ